MTTYLEISTLSLATDDTLLRSVPSDVADYYQALPLAEEVGQVTIATPHPDNRMAIRVLARLMGMDVVPVAASEAAVSSAIRRIYPAPAPPRELLYWSDSPAGVARAQTAAIACGQALELKPRPLLDGTSLAGLAAALKRHGEALLVACVSDPAVETLLLRAGPGAQLLVRGEVRPLRRILVALRGYGSDYAALRQVEALVGQDQATITLLPLSGSVAGEQVLLPALSDVTRQHLNACARQVSSPVSVRLRGGDALDQLTAELSEVPCDMLVIAAEGWGQFVLQILRQIQAAGVLPDQPILIVRPPVVWDSHDDDLVGSPV